MQVSTFRIKIQLRAAVGDAVQQVKMAEVRVVALEAMDALGSMVAYTTRDLLCVPPFQTACVMPHQYLLSNPPPRVLQPPS